MAVTRHMSVVCELIVVVVLGGFLLYLFSRLTWGSSVRPTVQPTVSSHPALNHPRMRVFVTGAAGFIGYHLAMTLSADGNFVVAMDNFNDYYDVRLKMDRAYELHKKGIAVYYDDVCNTDYLEDMFAMHNFTHVAHMAAQAGVRYSLQNPLAYVRANVECQLALLDVLKKYPTVKLVYASSSSVYGKNSKIPFQLSAKTDNPGNMYAATKKTDELLGYHYCETYKISSVGLRFFTVYGPWGRPDMAVFKFAESILDGTDVPMFHVSDDNPLARDFTYVEDVVNGIIAALGYHPTECGERFNLGFGHPVSVPGLVDILQEELAVPAKVKKLPLPPTEILRTWADIDTSTQFLGFKPQTDLKTGVNKFALWYKKYRQQRAVEEAKGQPTLADQWFQRLLADKEKRFEHYEEEAVTRQNDQLAHRLQHERKKYFTKGKDHGKEMPGKLEKGEFHFYQGMDSPGGNIILVPDMANDIEVLKLQCLHTEECIAFNSAGTFKRYIVAQDQWTKEDSLLGPAQGLYVVDIDVCEADLHDCPRHSLCTPVFPGQHKCTCEEGYYGDGRQCLPRYGLTRPLGLKREYMADHFSYYSIREMKQDKEMVFFQGLDSPGWDYLAADEYRGNHDMLTKICAEDVLCVAINTNGLMKRRVQPKSEWLPFSPSTSGGIFVFDINYCLLDDDKCPDHSSCQKVAPADYRCVCQDTSYEIRKKECVMKTTKKNPLPESQKEPHRENSQQKSPDLVQNEQKRFPDRADIPDLHKDAELSSEKDAIPVILAVDKEALPGV